MITCQWIRCVIMFEVFEAAFIPDTEEQLAPDR